MIPELRKSRVCGRERLVLIVMCSVSLMVILCPLYLRVPSHPVRGFRPLAWNLNPSAITTSTDSRKLFQDPVTPPMKYYSSPELRNSQAEVEVTMKSSSPTTTQPTVSSTVTTYLAKGSTSNTSLPLSTQVISPQPSPQEERRGHFESRGYLLAASIEQQMTQAVMCYGDLATLASRLHLSSVKPYVQSTRLITLPTVTSHPMDLGTFYDLESFSESLKNCTSDKDHKMSTFESFVQHASRDVILVYFLSSIKKHSRIFSKRKVVEVGRKSVGKSPPALSKLNKWTTHLAKIKKMKLTPFKVSRVIMIDARPKKSLELKEIMYVLKSAVNQQLSKRSSVTVLVDNWRGIHNWPNSWFFYYIPAFHGVCYNMQLVNHSERVISASNAFALSLGHKKQKTIAIHIRGEKLFLTHKNFQVCFKKLSSILKGLKTKETAVYVFHDFGKYGTKSCRGKCIGKRKKFQGEVKKLGERVVYYDPAKFSSVPKNPAFASFVERDFLSKMDVLITLGQGSFQDSIVQRYKLHSNHSSVNLHRICN